MDALDSAPPPGDADWNGACERVERYLLAHGIGDRERVMRLVLDIIGRAKTEWEAGPSRPPVEVAMGLAIARVEEWFSLLGGGVPDAARAGRSGYFTGRARDGWGEAFLLEPPPAELVREVRDASLRAGPDLDPASLSRADVDYGPMEDLARETWEQFSWGHVIKAFVIWLLVFCAAYAAYLRFFQ